MALKIIKKDGTLSKVVGDAGEETGTAMMDSFEEWKQIFTDIRSLGDGWSWSLDRDITGDGWKGHAQLKNIRQGVDLFERGDTPIKALQECLRKAGKL